MRNFHILAGALLLSFMVGAPSIQAGFNPASAPMAAPSLVAVRDLVQSGQARFHVLSRETHGEKTDLQMVLVDQEGHSIGGYAPPYLGTQAEARELWKDFVTANLNLPVQPEAMTITEARSAENESFAVGFALDHSQSMTMPRAIRMQRAVQAALRTFDPNDFVTVFKFTGSVNEEVSLSNSADEYLASFKVNGLTSRGNGSAVYDAAIQAIHELSAAPSVSRRILVLFTDGEDNSSSATPEDVINEAKANNVVIHGVTFGVSNDDPIAKISSGTDGRLHRLADIYDFDRVFLGIYNALRHSYSITVKINQNNFADASIGATMTAAGSSSNVRTNDVIAMLPHDGVEIANSTTSEKSLVMNVELVFADQTHNVSPADVPLLDSIATVLIQRKDIALEILNNTDASIDENQAHRRANAVRDLLIRRGVPPSRVQSYSGRTAAADPIIRRTDTRKTTFVFTRL